MKILIYELNVVIFQKNFLRNIRIDDTCIVLKIVKDSRVHGNYE